MEVKFWTRKDGLDYECRGSWHRRIGSIQKCGKCRRGVVAHGYSLLRGSCLICGGKVRKSVIEAVSAPKEIPWDYSGGLL